MTNVAEEIALLRGTRAATFRDLLKESSFSRLWRAMLISSLGDWVGFVAVAALVARLGGQRVGPLAVAGVMLARLLPSVLFGPFAGVLADRFDRKKLMVRSDIARGLLYASMPLLPGIGYILLLSFVIECLSLLWGPAKDASIPNLVPRSQLPNANSVGLATTYGTLPLGALIYTALAGVSAGFEHTVPYLGNRPEALALWLDAITFLFSALMVSKLDLRRPGVARPREGSTPKLNLRSAWQDVREGIRFLQAHPTIRVMTVGIVIAFGAVGAVIALAPIFSRYSLNAGSTGFGVLVIALGVGMGAGMASLSLLTRVIDREKLFWLAMFWAALFLFLAASMPSLAAAALFAVPMGAGVGATWVTGYTMLQESTSDEFRGRTFATLTITARMALFVSLAAFPALSAAVGTHRITVAGQVLVIDGTRISMYLAGAVAVMAGVFSRRGLRRIRRTKPQALELVPKFGRRDNPGLLVVFEGVEGSGKGTQIELARKYLESLGRRVLVTREPGGTGLGDRLRQTVLDPETGRIDPRAEALLFAAARANLVSAVIRPALEEGKVVLCDRFVDSSLAYQGAGRGLGEHDVLTLNAWATQGLFPDVVILLNLRPEYGLARAVEDAPDRIEAEDLAFHGRVAEAYLKIAEEHPERFRVIDAEGSADEVHKRVREVLDSALGRVDEEGR